MQTAIELFSGCENVSNFLRSKNWDVISIDNNPRFKPTICTDVLNITKSMLPGSVQFFWISVPCTTFSREAPKHHFSKTIIKYRNFYYEPVSLAAQLSLKVLDKCIEILSWYPDAFFIFENPVGRFHHFHQLRALPHYRYYVNYINYGFDYSKETYLFSNFLLPFASKKTVYPGRGVNDLNTAFQRSKVPSGLIEFIYNSTLIHILSL